MSIAFRGFAILLLAAATMLLAVWEMESAKKTAETIASLERSLRSASRAAPAREAIDRSQTVTPGEGFRDVFAEEVESFAAAEPAATAPRAASDSVSENNAAPSFANGPSTPSAKPVVNRAPEAASVERFAKVDIPDADVLRTDEFSGTSTSSAPAENLLTVPEPPLVLTEDGAAQPEDQNTVVASVDDAAPAITVLEKRFFTRRVLPRPSDYCEALEREETVFIKFQIDQRGKALDPEITATTNTCLNSDALFALRRSEFDTAELASESFRFSDTETVIRYDFAPASESTIGLR
ncbi:MAG: hypothetical protein AAGJ87_13090 [Pseudomonadota bacterium]